MNILSFLKSVKSNIQENKNHITIYKEALSELLYLMSPEKNTFELVKSSEGYTFHHLKPFPKENLQDKCSFSVPCGVAHEPKKKQKQQRSRKNYSFIYPDLFKDNLDFRKDYLALKNAFVRYAKSWKWLKKEFDGVFRAFLVSEKGTPNYSKKMYWRIHDFAKKCDSHYKYCYFVTLTTRQKHYNGNLAQAWENFNESIGYYARKINAELQGDYIIALESHHSGMPHGHAVFYTNICLENPPEEYDHKKGTKCLCRGKFFELDKKWWKRGHTVIKVNQRQSTADYLAKYLNKGNVEYFLELAQKEKWSATDVKDVATLFLPKIFGIREFRLSQGKFPEEESLQEMCVNEFSANPKRTTSPKKDISPTPNGAEIEDFCSVLKALWIKSPMNCSRKLFICTQRDFEQKKLKNPMLLDKLPHATNHFLGEMGKQVSCRGCILSDLDSFVWQKNGKFLDFTQNWEYFLRFFTPYVETEKIEALKTQCKSLGKSERASFEKRMLLYFQKFVKVSEVEEFARAIYYTNPILFRYVLPPKWQQIAELFKDDYSEVADKFSNIQIIRIRSFLKERFA